MSPCDLSTIRGGRLLTQPSGYRDLATGWAVRLEDSLLRAATDIRDPRAGPRAAGEVVLDAWTTQDWLGRWRRWRVVASAAHTTEPVAVLDVDWASPGSVGVTRAPTLEAWCALAAAARRAGVVPVHGDLLPSLDERSARQWPPLLVACVGGEDRLPGSVARWVVHGGRIAGLALAPLGRLIGRAVGASVSRVATSGGAAHARVVHRAWRARARAPEAPSFLWCSPHMEGRTRMTHLELLDVTAALEEVRRDEDALVATCRAVRRHTGAHRVGVLCARGGQARVLATDDPSADAMHAWQRLCLDEGLTGVASSTGWHAAGRHGQHDGLSVHVCGTWRTQEEAAGRTELLGVFARLASARVPPATATSVATSPLADTLVGESVVMQDVRAQIALAARAPFPVLIRGESGCGKELAARAIHALGTRRHRRCAALNCAALPDDLIESELFGHVRGAFTGAAADRVGLFDDADGGTLFLDEVGELGARAQAKLLRVLQDGEVRRVGENTARRVDVRVIAATNVSLEEAVRRGTFRADLFYRLDVVRVRMPALRERREDIPLLARHFWRDCAARVGSKARLEGPVLEVLARHDWPGNVRQLQNTLAALAVRVPARGRVGVNDLPPELRHPDGTVPYAQRGGLTAARREFEATYVRDALSRAGGRPSLAARHLGLTRQGLSKLVRRLGLDETDEEARLP